MKRISTAVIVRRSFWDRDTLAALKREIQTQTGLSIGSLLSIDADRKTTKGRDQGWLTAALFLAAHTKGGIDACRFRDKCEASCIDETGMGQSPSVRLARGNRKKLLVGWPMLFLRLLRIELALFVRKAEREGLKPAARLNATTDIEYEKIAPWLFVEFAGVQFYDYTKYPVGERRFPKNYRVTYSWKPSLTEAEQTKILSEATIAVPFAPITDTDRVDPLPDSHLGYPVANGDKDDLIFLHPPGTVIGLEVKGKGGSRPAWAPGMFAVAKGALPICPNGHEVSGAESTPEPGDLLECAECGGEMR